MKHILRLLLAILVGLAAAVLNWYWMSQERSYPEYAYVAQPIAVGEPITKDKLKSVKVKGDEKVLGSVLVPWRQKELWYDRFASRDYSANSPLFQRDMAETGAVGSWDTLGPFILVGVGNEPTAAFSGEQGELIPVSGNILTLAVDESQNEEKGLLYRYLAAMRGEYYFNETATERNLLKIIGVEPKVSSNRQPTRPEANFDAGRFQLRDDGQPNRQQPVGQPLGQPNAQPNQQPDFSGKRLIFVSLENVPNAPTWLRIGEEIYFMVPPGKQRLLGKNEALPVAGY